MTRVLIDFDDVHYWTDCAFSSMEAVAAVAPFGLPVHFDEELLFWEQHFESPRQFAMYDNGHRKGGTLRFKDGHVRLPAYPIMKVYQTEEFKQGLPPRFLQHLGYVVVCPAHQLTQQELDMDGFRDHEHMVEAMQAYYPTMRLDSIVSFYKFDPAITFPNAKYLENYEELLAHVMELKKS